MIRRSVLPLALVAALAVASACASTEPAFALRAQPQAVVDQYEFVRGQVAVYEQIACYCGCGETLGHRHLRDCFFTDDGIPDPHASSCGVCIAESTEVRRMLGEGMDVPAIAEAIDATFAGVGPPTSNGATE